MTNKLLGIIAINLTIITGLMVLQSIPTATAQSGVQKIALCDEYGDCANITGGSLSLYDRRDTRYREIENRLSEIASEIRN